MVENQKPIKAADDGDHSLDLDAAVRDLAEAIDVDGITGAITAGQDEAEIRVNIDETAPTQATRSSGLVDRYIGFFIFAAFFLSFSIFNGMPYDLAVALGVWFTSLFFSFPASEKQRELWRNKVMVRLDKPVEGFAVVDGVVELSPDADAFTCEWTRRKCVFFEFRVVEWKIVQRQEGNLTVDARREWCHFKDSKSVPFVIRNAYGTARVKTFSPHAGEFKESYQGAFVDIRRLGGATGPTHNGTVVQQLAELMPGQHVTVSGQMSVDKEGGVSFGRVEFGTHSRPHLIRKADSIGASWLRLPVLLLLGDVIPAVYIIWLIFDSV